MKLKHAVLDLLSSIKENFQRDPYAITLLLGLPLLGHVFESTMGFYKLKYMSFFLIFLGFFAWSYFKKLETGPKQITHWGEKVLYLNLLFWGFMMAVNPHFEVPENKILLGYSRAVFALNFLIIILLNLSFFWPDKFQWLKNIKREKWLVFANVLMLHSYFIVPYVTTNPAIDVFQVIKLGAVDLLAGKNPFSQMYPILDFLTGAIWESGYCYWPGVLLTTTFSEYVFGDPRIIYAIGIGLATFLFYRVALQRGWKKEMAMVLSLTWLTFPTAILTIELTWNEFILIIYFSLFSYFLLQSRLLVSAIFFGFLIASKQYTAFFGLVMGAYLLRSRGIKETLQFTAISLSSFGLMMIPFWVWHWDDFYKYTITYLEGVKERADGFTLIAFGMNSLDILPHPYFYLAVYAIGTIVISIYLLKKKRNLRDLFVSFYLMYAVIFLFGKQAFMGYYYLHCYILFFIIVLSLSSKPKDEIAHDIARKV